MSKRFGSLLPDDIETLTQDAIMNGLAQGNANMVKVVSELIESEQVGEFMSNLTINVVPFTIPDTELTNIVLKADDEVVGKIKTALKVREQKTKKPVPEG
jgi:hypothetical protein